MKKFLPAIFINLSAALSEFLLMSASAWLIVSAALKPPLSALSVGITLVRTAGISRAVLRYFDRFFSHKTIFKFLDELREKIFLKAAEKFPLKSGKIFEGEMLHDLTVEADLRKDFLPRVILPLTTAFFATIFLSILLKSILPVIIFLLNIIFVKFFSVEEINDSKYRGKILDFYEGRDELKIFGIKPAIKKLNSAAENFAESQKKISYRQINFETAIKLLNASGISIILYRLEVERIKFAVWIFILLSFFEILCMIAPAVQTYKKISAKKVEQLPAKKSLQTSTNFAVEFKNVCFGYDENYILKNFNLEIKRGENICIVGESGAGKTTLMYLMTQIFLPDSGEIFITGKVFSATHDNYIFSDSIRKNFEIYCGEIAEDNINSFLKMCQLENFNIDEKIGENGNFLSGGERVRLQIALAIAKNPEILILDEPTAGLDKICGEKLIETIKNYSAEKNLTLIVITHDKNISKNFPKTIKIN